MIVFHGAMRSFAVQTNVDERLEVAVRSFIDKTGLSSHHIFGNVRPGDLLLTDPEGESTNWTSSNVDQWTDTARSTLYSGTRTSYKKLIVSFRDPQMQAVDPETP